MVKVIDTGVFVKNKYGKFKVVYQRYVLYVLHMCLFDLFYVDIYILFCD